MANFAEDWLTHCGYQLGYDYENLPNINDCILIKEAYDMGLMTGKKKQMKTVNELSNNSLDKWYVEVEVEYDKDGGQRIIYLGDDKDER